MYFCYDNGCYEDDWIRPRLDLPELVLKYRMAESEESNVDMSSHPGYE